MRRILTLIIVATLTLFSCVEKGKPIKKANKTTVKTDKKKIDHYTCPKGHKGSDNAGVCPECGSSYLHNQAYHGKQYLVLPDVVVGDVDKKTSTTNTTPAPAQNAYGDYHYVCPNGHAEGSGTASNCPSCTAKLVHNQDYHR